MTFPLLDIQPAPAEPPRCRRCHRVCRNGTTAGYGPECAAIVGLVVAGRSRAVVGSGPDLLSLINEGEPMVIETLHENEWLSLRIVRKPEAGIDGYVYAHATNCHGRMVAILPYVDEDARRYLVKSEVTPCWGLDPQLSAVTGRYEGGNIEDDAVREVLEETGYTVTRDDLIPLGECYAGKSADTVYSLFAVNLTGRVPDAALGDGSRLEAESTAVWVLERTLAEIRDPHVPTMLVRLKALGYA